MNFNLRNYFERYLTGDYTNVDLVTLESLLPYFAIILLAAFLAFISIWLKYYSQRKKEEMINYNLNNSLIKRKNVDNMLINKHKQKQLNKIKLKKYKSFSAKNRDIDKKKLKIKNSNYVKNTKSTDINCNEQTKETTIINNNDKQEEFDNSSIVEMQKIYHDEKFHYTNEYGVIFTKKPKSIDPLLDIFSQDNEVVKNLHELGIYTFKQIAQLNDIFIININKKFKNNKHVNWEFAKWAANIKFKNKIKSKAENDDDLNLGEMPDTALSFAPVKMIKKITKKTNNKEQIKVNFHNDKHIKLLEPKRKMIASSIEIAKKRKLNQINKLHKNKVKSKLEYKPKTKTKRITLDTRGAFTNSNEDELFILSPMNVELAAKLKLLGFSSIKEISNLQGDEILELADKLSIPVKVIKNFWLPEARIIYSKNDNKKLENNISKKEKGYQQAEEEKLYKKNKQEKQEIKLSKENDHFINFLGWKKC